MINLKYHMVWNRRCFITHRNLDNVMIEKAVKLGKFKSKEDAVNTAVSEYVQRHSQASLIELFGKIDYDPGYSYKKLRVRRKSAI